MKKLISAFSLVLVTGCATQLAPQAEAVRVTKKPADVATWKMLGTVDAQPPFPTTSDARNEMGNRVAVLGGDTLLLTNYSTKKNGIAYRCTPGVSGGQ